MDEYQACITTSGVEGRFAWAWRSKGYVRGVQGGRH
jgi:hypothetical protein